jgi:prepilin-type N-terminal cleavage/methylation domain-containing protein/prepilin-type processing-associated H-X9-DG protein
MNVAVPHATEVPPARSAFTLVELLTVLAVIGILAALLLPALAGTRDSSRSTTCLGHLRQWGLATRLYEIDSGGWLPGDGAPNGISTHHAWYADLPPTIGIPPYHDEGPWRTNAQAPLGHRPWFCPSNPRRSNGHLLFHFALNRRVNGSGRDSRRTRLESIPAPSRTVWLFDNGQRAAVAGPGNLHRTLHRGAANILFLDGGARRVTPAQAGPAKPEASHLGDTEALLWTP